jgi:hypothetical protein
MAAGGFRNFVAGETLDEEKINDFLMQGILVFADATARDAAITAPVHGQFCFLKDVDGVEFYDGDDWVELESGLGAAVVSATTGSPTITSGTVISGITYDIYDFTGDGSITIDKDGLADLLLIGGGGAGGVAFGGGGGAGGLLFIEDAYLPAGTATVDVGAGGVGRLVDATSAGNNGEGGRSSVLWKYFAVGGGAGVGLTSRTNVTNNYFGNIGGNGGSGGGGGGHNLTQHSFIGFGTPGQGNDGGTDGFLAGGGGGGAGAVGSNPGSQIGGNGGAGASNSITGSAVTYAGGGAGSGNATNGTGGSGGGGNAGSTGSNGTDNLGGGGGGSTAQNAGGNGGAGRIIVRVRV